MLDPECPRVLSVLDLQLQVGEVCVAVRGRGKHIAGALLCLGEDTKLIGEAVVPGCPGRGLNRSAEREQQSCGDMRPIPEPTSLASHGFSVLGEGCTAQLPGGPAMSWYIQTRKP